MKRMFIVLLYILHTYMLNAQTIAINKTTTFSYDSKGNITSRKGLTIPPLKPGSDNGRIDISGDISIIGKDNKFTIDLKKDYGTTATLQVSDMSPVVVKSAEFTKQTYTVDMNDCPAGVYIFNVKVAGSEATRKVMKY